MTRIGSPLGDKFPKESFKFFPKSFDKHARVCYNIRVITNFCAHMRYYKKGIDQ